MGGNKKVKNLSIRLSEKEVRRIKFLCFEGSMTLRDWYRNAFKRFVDQRVELEEQGERQLYRARPATAVQVSLVTDAGVVNRLRDWARADNVRFVAAYYTAIIEYLEECEINEEIRYVGYSKRVGDDEGQASRREGGRN